MTVGQLIERLNKLGKENLNKEVVMFDGPSYYTPYKVEIVDDCRLGKNIKDKVLID
jgi:hypothetical protein